MLNLINIIKQNKFVVITGQAGAGKTYLASKCKEQGFANVYSTDFRFFGDSNYRKTLLETKKNNFFEYVEAMNQYSWWDWNTIEKEVFNCLKNKSKFVLETVYNRDTGNIIDILEEDKKETFILEGAIISESLLKKCDKIVCVVADDELRFNRLLKKDRTRRHFIEIINRYMITNYSENLYFNNVLSLFKDKIIFIDENYNIINYKHINNKNYIPLEVQA